MRKEDNRSSMELSKWCVCLAGWVSDAGLQISGSVWTRTAGPVGVVTWDAAKRRRVVTCLLTLPAIELK